MNPTRDEQVESTTTGDNVGHAPAFGRVVAQLSELRAYVAQYIAAQIDRAKISIRRLIVLAVLGVIGLLVCTAALGTLVVLLLSGLAQAIGAALGGRVWAGDLIVGGGALLLLFVSAWLGLGYLKNISRKAMVDRYERRLRRQRIELGGHDARQRSAEDASKTDL